MAAVSRSNGAPAARPAGRILAVWLNRVRVQGLCELHRIAMATDVNS